MAGLFDTTSTSTTTPWGPAQPHLQQVMGAAQQNWQNRVGFNATPLRDLYTPYGAQTQQALGGMWNAASQGNPLAGQSMGALSGYMPGGAMANQYQGLYGQAGTNAADLMSRYQTMYNQSSNPYFAQALQNQSDLTAADIQRQFGSMGRIGSAADTGALASQLGQLRTNAMAQNWNQNIQNQMGALSGYGGAQQAGLANQQGILSGLTGAQMQAVQAAPGAYQASMMPYQYQMQVGQAWDDQARQLAAAKAQRFQTQQQAPWNRTSAYSNLVGGGGIGNYTSTSQNVGSSPFGMLAGLGLAGASLLYPRGIGG